MRTVKVGLLGCGTVGGGFFRLLEHDKPRIAARYGLNIDVHRILVRQPEKHRPGVPRELITRIPTEVIDPAPQIVIELIGGTHSAGAFVRRALALGHGVVTANKALLSAHGKEIFGEAARRGVRIGFEASVCGGIPIIRFLQKGLAGDTIESITGIVNGTCNYILGRMEHGLSFDTALREAQQRGFAEADPTLDVTGMDAAQKIRILSDLAFDVPIRRETVTGIIGITLDDLRAARRKCRTLRLIAEAQRVPGGVEVRVEPRELAHDDPLANARDETNAVRIRGRALGELLLVGRGAGAMPTATAVLADVIDQAMAGPAGVCA
jgi:homoserine dehydrogenase